VNNYNQKPEAQNAKAPDAIERTAADWVLRRENGLSSDEEKEFSLWLKEAPRHEQVYAETAETAQLLGNLRFHTPQGTVSFTQNVRSQQRRASFMRAALAVAAVTVVVLFGWRQLVPTASSFSQSVATQVGGLQKLELPDGSVVLLNTNTAVDVRYLKFERRVKLVRGEAYFIVAKNPARPFYVEAGSVAVRAVGTAFNVCMQSDSVNVLVTEGKVRVAENSNGAADVQNKRSEDQSPVLSVGNLGQVPLGTDNTSVSESIVITLIEPRAIKSVLAWQEGRLEFFEKPLSEVVAEFNRYNKHKVVIADPALAARRFGGAFASHQIEPLLEVLEQSFGVISEERGDETVIRLGK
jgi:transmembrane sensor